MRLEKTLAELETAQDKWFYILRHWYKLQEIPTNLNEIAFIKSFEAIQIVRSNFIKSQENSFKLPQDFVDMHCDTYGNNR